MLAKEADADLAASWRLFSGRRGSALGCGRGCWAASPPSGLAAHCCWTLARMRGRSSSPTRGHRDRSRSRDRGGGERSRPRERDRDPHKMDEFTEKVLRFWRGKREKLPNFRAAARIAFALKPNSASCERVFSLLKQFFGEQEDDSLADLIQAILMLNYNNRSPG